MRRRRTLSFRIEAYRLAMSIRAQSIVEVGVWKGELSRMFYTVTNDLTLVDPWDVAHLDFGTYTCKMGERLKTQLELDTIVRSIERDMPRAKVLRTTSMDASLQVADHSVDFVYIDAVHIYRFVKEDIEAWKYKLRPGGILAGDDYCITDVNKAVNEMLTDVKTIGRGSGRGSAGHIPRTWYKVVI